MTTPRPDDTTAVQPDTGSTPPAPAPLHANLAAFVATLAHELAQRQDPASAESALHAAALASRQLLAERWAATQAADAQRGDTVRRVHYLSLEFLIGRAMNNAVSALGLADTLQAELSARNGPALGELLEREPDAALGNGGLGRLAACFLDAFATLGLPSFGYGLFYQHGMFAQAIQEGRQVELPDEWLKHGNPWEFVRPEVKQSASVTAGKAIRKSSR